MPIVQENSFQILLRPHAFQILAPSYIRIFRLSEYKQRNLARLPENRLINIHDFVT